jgi:four helix bundle protein
MGAKNYRELIVWQKAMDLVEEVYALTKLLPRDELYALTNQIRRAVVSIPSNIAEGNGRHTPQEYIRFLSIARGSKSEVETQLEICIRLKYIDKDQANKTLGLCEEIGKMLNSMIQKLTPNP